MSKLLHEVGIDLSKLLHEAGIERLTQFKNAIAKIGNFPITEIAQEIIDHNDYDYWYNNRDKLSKLFVNYGAEYHDQGKTVSDFPSFDKFMADMNKELNLPKENPFRWYRYYNTYTPNHDYYPKEVCWIYDQFLRDIKENWSRYIPVMTRVWLAQYNIYERIEYAIKFMNINGHLFVSRMFCYRFADQQINNYKDKVAEIYKKLIERELTLTADLWCEISNNFWEMKRYIDIIQTPPKIMMSSEPPALAFDNVDQYYEVHTTVAARKNVMPAEISCLEDLVVLEKECNRLVKMKLIKQNDTWGFSGKIIDLEERLYKPLYTKLTAEINSQRPIRGVGETLLPLTAFRNPTFFPNSKRIINEINRQLPLKENSYFKVKCVPKFDMITRTAREYLNIEKIEQFDALVTEQFQDLVSQLNDYINSADNKDKLHLAQILSQLLARYHSEDATTKCINTRYHLQHIQLFHLSLLINEGHSFGRLGEILEKALEAFIKLERQITVENCRRLALKVNENLEVAEDLPEEIFYLVK